MGFMASQITGQSSLFGSILKTHHRTTSLALCEGNPPVTGGFPPQRVSNAKSVPWHYVNMDKSVKYCSEGVNNGDHLTPVLQRGLYWCIVILLLTHWHLGHLDTILKIQFSIFVLLIGILRSNHALRWMPRDPTDDKSTLVQVMPWCRQALIHYLRRCWPRSIPYGVTMPRWVK